MCPREDGEIGGMTKWGQEFGIEISDNDVERLMTAGQLTKYVSARVK
jgi:acyl carrier protein